MDLRPQRVRGRRTWIRGRGIARALTEVSWPLDGYR
jgi:hypothetical protein